ncbi:Cyclic AMP receptor 1 [Ceratobasidium theobromae]|uniref:Cyclic AMP receptor 1 n=1 Tax=Ceratobasidium theobromae TaxID=1582974 RepID=A0A5N5QHI3_9AGAM|nr:Cyclic AMP receptor 1 [Ceratobasidium theobromae]
MAHDGGYKYVYAYKNEYPKIGNRIGLALIGVTGLISAISTGLLLAYIMWYSFLSKKRDQPMVQAIRSFTHSALGAFLCSLLLSDMIQGAAFAINFKWAVDGDMKNSLACIAQASVSQFGDLGSALWSLAIAYYTFSLLFLVRKPPVWTSWFIFLSGWALIFILPIIGPYTIQDLDRKGPFYAVSGAWCWLGNGYQVERFLYVYMWIFMSLATSIVLYGLVYLRFSGRLVLKDGKLAWSSSAGGWRATFTSRGSRETNRTSNAQTTQPTITQTQQVFTGRRNDPDVRDPSGVGKHLKTVSKRLMLYPLVYSIVTLPVAACRIGTMVGWKPPLPLYVFAGMTFTSSGLTNVILFIITRHSLLRKVVSIRPHVLVTTHQVTVLEDSRGVQTIHLRQLSPGFSQGCDLSSDKDLDIEAEGSIVVKMDSPSAKEISTPSTPTVGAPTHMGQP